MKRKHIGLVIALLVLTAFASCGKKGSTGPAGAAGEQGTPGPTLPSVTWVIPVPESIDVPIDSVIRASFTKAMDASTLNSSTFRVSAGGVQITGTISYNSGSQTVYFSPNVPLSAFAYFSVVLTTGVKATEGTALAQDYSWSFTTGGSFAPSRLYVVNIVGSSLLTFNNAGHISGNIAPDRALSGSGLNQPWTLYYDKGSDQIYNTNFTGSSVTIFNNASTTDIALSRTLTGAGISYPAGLWVDTASDKLYVSNFGNNSISVFNNLSTINGSVAPNRTVSGGNTGLNGPGEIWLDKTTDTLYVAGYMSSSILTFTATTMNGNIAPNRVISGAGTGLTAPVALWLDKASDTLYVSGYYASQSITIFNNASTINGNVSPSRRIIGGATGLSWPCALWLDPSTDSLYVSNVNINSIEVFAGASTINGNVAPSRVISGGNTGFSWPTDIWLDKNP